MNVLGQQAKLQPARANHVTAIGRFFLRHQLEDGRLAGAVTAHEPDMLTGIHLQRGATQDILRTERLLDI
jgi:hypothetical protein